MEQLILDVSVLPETAKIELKDFYEFLLIRYSEKKEKKKTDFISRIPRKVDPFTPLKRDEIYER